MVSFGAVPMGFGEDGGVRLAGSSRCDHFQEGSSTAVACFPDSWPMDSAVRAWNHGDCGENVPLYTPQVSRLTAVSGAARLGRKMLRDFGD